MLIDGFLTMNYGGYIVQKEGPKRWLIITRA